ncbi:hypothetical protein TpMuguga_01g00282 [Theileria parva strain Muguga]|uniref:uncharacterized protein n=1 Tax=Theileria parva strain Muguga TaxID=333668 RepID=UPI001C617585|nr:uncharacterized protein TpMuguga_01g00282 [Theileria parva strain Muguga]EAN33526.2 hypothetical protein TpMuguga_01g00282 [Theileria parva strain Muguga]
MRIIHILLLVSIVCCRRIGRINGRHKFGLIGPLESEITHYEGPQYSNGKPKMACKLLLLKLKISKYLLWKRIWFGTLILKYHIKTKYWEISKKLKKLFKFHKESEESPHYPLVGNKWVLEFNKPPKYSNIPGLKEYLKFADDGTVTTVTGLTGHWWEEMGHLMWKFPVESGKNEFVYFKTEFMFDSRKNKPVMCNGIVFKDRPENGFLPKYLFRPVLCKFKGHCL